MDKFLIKRPKLSDSVDYSKFDTEIDTLIVRDYCIKLYLSI